METPVTKRFGRYEVVGELGRGAMGVVYKARDPQIDRLVAVKTVSLRGQDVEAEKEFRLRFLNEAQAAGRLHHPGIVSVFDVGEDAETGDPYIVLEFVSGEALNRILARERKLALPRALQLAEEIARALNYAHEQGVTHRDIKPGNILITTSGHAKIADFGIAKLNLATFTLPGKLLGTPAYMAPEQLAGEGVDGRSDLFSLGVILYAMVTGHSPFQGDSATTVCFKVANREPLPASALDLELPRELDAVISRAMAKDPKRRYQFGAELADHLAELRSQSTPAVATQTGTRTTKNPPTFSGKPAVGLPYAWKLIRSKILQTPVRDLALGFATIVMLWIVGVQSKLLVGTHHEATNSADATQARVVASRTEPPLPPTDVLPIEPTPMVRSATPESTPAPNKSQTKTVAKTVAKKVTPPQSEPKETSVPNATVELAIRHQFKDATLSIFIDGKRAMTRPLHGGAQKRLVVFGGVRGMESETLPVPAGKHEIRIQAETDDHTVNLSKTISSDFAGGTERTLQISFEKHNSGMKLEWQ